MSPLLQRQAKSALGFLGAVGGDKYWIAVLGGSATEISYNAVSDTDGNVYIFGRSNSAGTTAWRQTIAKYDKDGNIQWQKQLSNNMHPAYYDAFGTVDSSGNPIAYNSTTNGSWGGIVITKLTPAGAITWQRAMGTSNDAFADTILTDSSGNIYVSGPMNDGGGYQLYLIKHNSSGTLQWQRKTSGEGHGVAIDSSGNIYAGGFAGGTYGLQLNKYNSSGSLLLQTRLNGQYGYDTYGGRCVCDSSDNVYASGLFRQSSGTGYEFVVFKRNSSGTLQWQRVITNSSSSYGIVVLNVAVDSSDNVYGVGYTNISGQDHGIVAKWNSSGTLQWQRTFKSSSGNTAFSSIKFNSTGTSMYISSYTNVSGNYDYVLLKLPTDGTLTGTYTVGSYSYTYAASSLTEAAYSGSNVSGSLTDNAGTFGSSTPSNTISNTSFANAVKVL